MLELGLFVGREVEEGPWAVQALSAAFAAIAAPKCSLDTRIALDIEAGEQEHLPVAWRCVLSST